MSHVRCYKFPNLSVVIRGWCLDWLPGEAAEVITDITHPARRMAGAPLARSVIALSRSAMNRKRLWQRFGRISVSDESHCGYGPRAGARVAGKCPSPHRTSFLRPARSRALTGARGVPGAGGRIGHGPRRDTQNLALKWFHPAPGKQCADCAQ